MGEARRCSRSFGAWATRCVLEHGHDGQHHTQDPETDALLAKPAQRVALTLVIEYEATPADYDTADPHEIAAVDMSNWRGDPHEALGSIGADGTVTTFDVAPVLPDA